MSYAEKENYVSVHPDPETWRSHANFQIMKFYEAYIRGNIVDAGCNHGACTLLLLDWADKIESIYGLDMNYDALSVGFKIANEMNPPIPVSFLAVNLLEIPLDSDKFDFTMSFHTLEHIYPEDASKYVKEILRILKPGGHFLISIPYEHAYPDFAHVAFYNVESLCLLFESAGFYTIEAMKDNRWNEKELLTAMFMKPY